MGVFMIILNQMGATILFAGIFCLPLRATIQPWAAVLSSSLFARMTSSTTSSNSSSKATNPLFSTKAIRNTPLMHKIFVEQEGLETFSYKTEDGVNLTGYKKIRSDATCNLVFFAGITGRPTDNAPFLEIFRNTINQVDNSSHIYNFYFLSSRNIKTYWRLHPQVMQLGVNGSKDAIAGLRYVNKENALPIVAVGLCTGAVNLTNAINILEKNNEKIPGCLIFDSGFSSPKTTVKTALQAMACHWIDKRFGWNGHYTQDRPLWLKGILRATQSSVGLFADGILSCWTNKAEKIANLDEKIKDLHIPILFIHNAGDKITPLEGIINLYLNAPHSELWIIEEKVAKTNHSVNQLIQKKEYKEHCEDFIMRNVRKGTS